MTIPVSLHFGIWSTAVLAWAALSYEYRHKWQNHLEKLAEEIRNYNSGRYDQSVGRDELARAFRNPWKSDSLEEFAGINGVSVEDYKTELRDAIGNPQRIYWAIVFHIFGLAVTILGIVYLGPWKLPFATEYLMSIWALFLVSFGLYWYL